MNGEDWRFALFLPAILIGSLLQDAWKEAPTSERLVLILLSFSTLLLATLLHSTHYSTSGLARKRRLSRIASLPSELLKGDDGVNMGEDIELEEKIYLPDSIRKRHVHVIGATGSGKTESVILNFLRQDVARGFGSVILDAKGDLSFLTELQTHVPSNKLIVFDLGDPNSTPYNPVAVGSPLEASQRLFSSLVWSEEYYRSKALSALQRLFQTHFESRGVNPTINELARYLENPKKYAAFVMADDFPTALAMEEFKDLSGLRDQLNGLSIGYLRETLSPATGIGIDLNLGAQRVGYLFPFAKLDVASQLVSTVGKMVINHLNYMAGSAHRSAASNKLVPVYLDEFASFACPEFADLISKARSANFALHFSHQSIGDLAEVAEGFLQ